MFQLSSRVIEKNQEVALSHQKTCKFLGKEEAVELKEHKITAYAPPKEFSFNNFVISL